MNSLKIFLCFGLITELITGSEKILLGPGPGNTPVDNLEVLWKTIDEKYGLFPISHVNWDSLYMVYYNRLNRNTSDDELWNISCQMLSHLQNGHICLFNKSYNNWYTPDNPPAEIHNSFSIDVVKSRYLKDPVVTGEGNITSGKIRNTSLGYTGIRSFHGAENGRDWIRDMDEVIRNLYQCDGIIIDMRNNGGGFARNDLYAASFFTDREIIYYYSMQKTGTGHNDFGNPIAKIVCPRSDTLKYLKRIAVLTNRFTASGGEAFTLICNNLSNAIQIGDTTIGALGEVTHTAQLPNGWTLQYPCTLTILPDGTSPEGIGIIPDIGIITQCLK